MTFLEYTERYPPTLVRLLARKRYGPPMSAVEIADTAGISPRDVEGISQSVGWDDIPVGHLHAFTNACGVDFNDADCMDRINSYMKSGPTFRYLRASKDWNDYYLPLLVRWAKHNTSKWGPITAIIRRLEPIIT